MAHRPQLHSECYATLGLSPSASMAEVKRAYKRLALKFHPDKNPGDTNAEERFKQITRAYAVLSGSKHKPEPTARKGRNNDDFSDLYRGKREGPSRPQRARKPVELDIDFVTAMVGGERVIDVEAMLRCSTCTGTGSAPGTAVQLCHACGGSGEISVQKGLFATPTRCTYCHGRGRLAGALCSTCNGEGSTASKQRLTVRVPRGTQPGILKIVQHGVEWDVHLSVANHPVFRLEGHDIHLTLPISFRQATLGAELEVPTIDGRVRMRLPPGTASGRVLRLRGKGAFAASGERGDQHVKIVVEVPVHLSVREQALVESLLDTESDSHLPMRADFWRHFTD